MWQALGPQLEAVNLAAFSSRSIAIISAPSLLKSLAICEPITPPAPVIATTYPPSFGFLVLPSFACSRLQYSKSKVCFSFTGL